MSVAAAPEWLSVRQRTRTLGPRIWWGHRERTMLAFEDLGGHELPG